MLNKGALQFIKIKKDFNKDETFALGYIFGLKDAFAATISKNFTALTKEEVQGYVDDFVTEEMMEDVWNTLRDELELDLMDFKKTHLTANK